jgi:hypothetical protein
MKYLVFTFLLSNFMFCVSSVYGKDVDIELIYKLLVQDQQKSSFLSKKIAASRDSNCDISCDNGGKF